MTLFNPRGTRRTEVRINLLLACVLSFAPFNLITSIAFANSGNAQVAVASWLKVDSDVTEAWDAREISPDRVRFIMADDVESADNSSSRAVDKKVLFIFPKKSSAYNTALSTSLKVFADHGLFPEVEVALMEKDTAKRMEVIAAAEASNVDLIFATGSSSAKFAYKNYWGGKIPVVTICAKDPVMLGQMLIGGLLMSPVGGRAAA